MELPALLVLVQASMLLDPEQASQQLTAINEAVTGGATAVVLDGSDNAATLYDAAVKLKDVLRDRAALLLLDRLDIAAAVGAEGVVLSAKGRSQQRCELEACICNVYIH
jgi:thiamine monophosphate synthase